MEWRDIDINPKYEVSNTGRVRIKETGHTAHFNLMREGYLQTNIPNKPNHSTKLVHRLVAKAFIPNPGNKPQVNHIDGNKENNHVDNLEWVTDSENKIHSRDVIDRMDTETARKVLRETQDKPVQRLDLETGEVLEEYSSSMVAVEEDGFLQSKISSVCNGHRNSTGGYGWRFKNSEDVSRKRVRGITLTNEEEELHFDSRLKAAEYLGINSSTILYHQKRHKYEPFEYRGYLLTTEE